MKSRRIIGSLIATALASASLAVVTTAAPATAVDTVPTRIVSGSDNRGVISSSYKPLRYGDSISLSVNVEAFINGAWKEIYNGPVAVTRQVAGQKSAAVVAQTTSEAYLYASTPARGRARYVVYYGGGTGGYPAVNYAPSSAAYAVKSVQRKLTITPKSSRKKLGLAGKIAPKGKNRVIVLKKVGKKWKKYKGLRTTSRGTFFARLPAPAKRGKKILWKLVIPGSGPFARTSSGVYYTTKY